MKDVYTKAKSFFDSRQTFSYEFRLRQLKILEEMLHAEKAAIVEALHMDLGKPNIESLLGEWGFVVEETRLTIQNLKKWMKPQRVRTTRATFPAKSKIYSEPLGVVLVIGPWNYPFQLTIAPLIGALAAGNTVILKPSEIASHTADLISNLIAKYFDPRLVTTVQGGVDETTELLKIPFDHIFFTGSTAVGKVIAQAAAKNLTPVTLELGGKSPAIVCEDVDMEVVVRRLVWGKFFNAGQTCVAPDYVYVQNSVYEKFKTSLVNEILNQFSIDPEKSESLARIINSRNFQRLMSLINKDQVLVGGRGNAEKRFLAPTVLQNISWEDRVMQEEIFGPILPILKFENLDQAFNEIKKRDKPLSAYLFSKNKEVQKKFISEISAGGITINDVILHLSNPYLPFGGVGASGQGRYHGLYSFQTFSHQKSVLIRGFWLDIKARYAPYTAKKVKLLLRLLGT